MFTGLLPASNPMSAEVVEDLAGASMLNPIDILTGGDLVCGWLSKLGSLFGYPK